MEYKEKKEDEMGFVPKKKCDVSLFKEHSTRELKNAMEKAY